MKKIIIFAITTGATVFLLQAVHAASQRKLIFGGEVFVPVVAFLLYLGWDSRGVYEEVKKEKAPINKALK